MDEVTKRMEGASLDEDEHKRELYSTQCERDYWKNRAEELEEELKPYRAVCYVFAYMFRYPDLYLRVL